MRDRPSELPIRCEGVSLQIGRTRVLDGASVEIGGGAPTLLIGPNGAGKTTLLRVMKGLIPPTAGRITFAGRRAPGAHRVAMVFQRPVMLRRTAGANVVYALAAAGRQARPEAIGRLLALVGLSSLAARPARRLSGGEQQRLALARALAMEPEVLLLDEPTASLDPAATKALEDIVHRIAGTGVKVVMSTHDLGQARRLAGDVIFMVAGRVVEHRPAATFFTNADSAAARRFLAGELVF